jgi:DNA-binding transcriptional ArsR family regulator
MSRRKSHALSADQLGAVAGLFRVLAEPSRLALLQALQAGPLTVTALIDACGMKQANVSKHLAVLHQHQLVKRTPRGAAVEYEIADPIIFSLCNLVCGKIESDAKRTAALFGEPNGS